MVRRLNVFSNPRINPTSEPGDLVGKQTKAVDRLTWPARYEAQIAMGVKLGRSPDLIVMTNPISNISNLAKQVRHSINERRITVQRRSKIRSVRKCYA